MYGRTHLSIGEHIAEHIRQEKDHLILGVLATRYRNIWIDPADLLKFTFDHQLLVEVGASWGSHTLRRTLVKGTWGTIDEIHFKGLKDGHQPLTQSLQRLIALRNWVFWKLRRKEVAG